MEGDASKDPGYLQTVIVAGRAMGATDFQFNTEYVPFVQIDGVMQTIPQAETVPNNADISHYLRVSLPDFSTAPYDGQTIDGMRAHVWIVAGTKLNLILRVRP